MKKILSLTLAALMLLSAVPMAMAADTDVSNGTTIELVGSGSESYTVTVPAELQPGQSGTVKASGTWESGKTLKVTAPNSVTVSYGDQSMDIAITFAGITLAGNDLAAVSASADVTVADATALFGTWTGTLNYTVELAGPELVTCTLVSESGSYETTVITVEAGTTWGEYCESLTDDNNPLGLMVNDGGYVVADWNMATLGYASEVDYSTGENRVLPSDVMETRTYYII